MFLFLVFHFDRHQQDYKGGHVTNGKKNVIRTVTYLLVFDDILVV